MGTKTDLCKAQSVPEKLAKNYAQLNKIHYSEVSVKDMTYVKELLEEIAQHCLHKKPEISHPETIKLLEDRKKCTKCNII